LSNTYKSAGVDIKAGEETVDLIKKHVKSTFTKNVLSDIGHFGGFFEIPSGYKNPVLVSSTDGVGTKLKIAFAMNVHNTVGQDLVNHCVNDIAVCGAKPLYFLDYLAFGKLIPEKAEKIIEGFATACRENVVSLIGGETAEMPGLYNENEYDMSGTIVGIVEKDKIIDGRNVKSGNILVGFKSNGLHTNGYSLARKVLLDKYRVDEFLHEIQNTLGKELLSVHKSYLKLIELLKQEIDIKAFSHITGGGILGNTKRVIPKNCSLDINWEAWQRPAIFNLIKSKGNIPEEEMQKAFNLGIGLIAIVDQSDVSRVIELSKSLREDAIVIGKVI
jgi:phosphoribosylformylglycinamidine cyclo-ligase